MKKKTPKANQVLATHCYVFNKSDNGGEALMLTTTFIANGDPLTETKGVFLNQEIELQSYGNAATIKLFGACITPKMLRELAKELEIHRHNICT
jgi:hypothetical protein